jgi:hypothetical protein
MVKPGLLEMTLGALVFASYGCLKWLGLSTAISAVACLALIPIVIIVGRKVARRSRASLSSKDARRPKARYDTTS